MAFFARIITAIKIITGEVGFTPDYIIIVYTTAPYCVDTAIRRHTC